MPVAHLEGPKQSTPVDMMVKSFRFFGRSTPDILPCICWDLGLATRPDPSRAQPHRPNPTPRNGMQVYPFRTALTRFGRTRPDPASLHQKGIPQSVQIGSIPSRPVPTRTNQHDSI